MLLSLKRAHLLIFLSSKGTYGNPTAFSLGAGALFGYFSRIFAGCENVKKLPIQFLMRIKYDADKLNSDDLAVCVEGKRSDELIILVSALLRCLTEKLL